MQLTQLKRTPHNDKDKIMVQTVQGISHNNVQKSSLNFQGNPQAGLTLPQTPVIAMAPKPANDILDLQPQSAPVSFQGHKKDKPSQVKSGPAVASAFIPGSGQMMNGEWGKGLGILGGIIGLNVISVASTLDAMKNAGMHTVKNLPKSQAAVNIMKNIRGPVGAVVAGVGGLALMIYSISDAVKGANKHLEKPSHHKIIIKAPQKSDDVQQRKLGVQLDIQD